MDLSKTIREIKDFPKEGIGFKDITTLLKDKDAFKYMVDMTSKGIEHLGIELVVGPEARGFVIGAPVAYKLNAGFIPVRKSGKLPAETVMYEYELEYGTDIIEIHKDAIKPGQKVAVVDDLLATGGTTYSTIKLVEELGGEVVAVRFIIELSFLNGLEKLKGYDVKSLIIY